MRLFYPPGATPLDPNEIAGLIPDYITTLGELNELEAKNIQEAMTWLRRHKPKNILNVSFLLKLHKKMFGDVWDWSGTQRISSKNIGVPPDQIVPKLASLLKDADFWIANSTYPWDEIAARFHHKLVQIHIFSNGNGRHARLASDLLLSTNGKEPFSWGRDLAIESIENDIKTREKYIASLKEADKGNFELLIKFARN